MYPCCADPERKAGYPPAHRVSTTLLIFRPPASDGARWHNHTFCRRLACRTKPTETCRAQSRCNRRGRGDDPAWYELCFPERRRGHVYALHLSLRDGHADDAGSFSSIAGLSHQLPVIRDLAYHPTRLVRTSLPASGRTPLPGSRLTLKTAATAAVAVKGLTTRQPAKATCLTLRQRPTTPEDARPRRRLQRGARKCSVPRPMVLPCTDSIPFWRSSAHCATTVAASKLIHRAVASRKTRSPPNCRPVSSSSWACSGSREAPLNRTPVANRTCPSPIHGTSGQLSRWE